MSTIITEEIVKDIGEAWYTLKVDGTKDPTGCENISIVLRYVDTRNSVREQLVSMATSKQCDAKSLTQLVLAQLRDIGLNTAKVRSQCYDGVSGCKWSTQRDAENHAEELPREVLYVHCFNHQLHLVLVPPCLQLTLQVFQETYSGCSVHRREVEDVARATVDRPPGHSDSNPEIL